MKRIKGLIVIAYLFLAVKVVRVIKHFRFKKAVKKANKLHRLNRRRWHVLPVENNRFAVVDNKFINYYNNQNKGIKLTIDKLIELAAYSTPTSKESYKKLTKI